MFTRGRLFNLDDEVLSKLLIEWSNTRAYSTVPSVVIGSDNNVYLSTAANGVDEDGNNIGAGAVNPVGDTTGVWEQFASEASIRDVARALFDGNQETNITSTYNTSTEKIDLAVNNASQSQPGVARAATQPETDAGTSENLFVTPRTLGAKLDSFGIENPSRRQLFTSTGTFTTPSGASVLVVTVVGGGGGGASSFSSQGTVGDGGRGGVGVRIINNPSGAYAVSIGSGGAGAPLGGNGSNGNQSSFGGLITANGGAGGAGSTNGSTGSVSGSTYRPRNPEGISGRGYGGDGRGDSSPGQPGEPGYVLVECY